MIRFVQETAFVCWLVCVASIASANPIGVNFSSYAPGTQFHYSYSGLIGSGRYIDIYQGVTNGQHIVHRHAAKGGKPGPLRRIIAYDAAGRMLSQERRALRMRTVWQPFHCVRSGLARCEHVRITYDAKTGAEKSSTRKAYETKLRGRTLHVVTNADSNRLKSTHKLGENNLLVKRSETIRSNGKNVRQTVQLQKIVQP
ncbi:hypothetical protein [uncultured Sulfitobacter sp.]|uniref:hypothetical protein n=1 Tax=uncultured Sulfitobacter sp. TaxID=191468 RepID=UPI002609EC71|nr:hypothetical protein [uncultured Sulfitobacter sp.]